MHAESCGPAHHRRAIAKLLLHQQRQDRLQRPTSICPPPGTAPAPLRTGATGRPERRSSRSSPPSPPTSRRCSAPGRCHRPRRRQGARLPSRHGHGPRRSGPLLRLMAHHGPHVAARIAELEPTGLADDTIVFYFGDHGGDCRSASVRRRTRQPRALDHLVRSRTTVIWRRGAPAVTVDAPVAGVDLRRPRSASPGRRSPTTSRGAPFLGRGARRPSTPSPAQSDG